MNNWITKFIKPGLKTLLKKVRPKPGEDSLWITCGGCQQLIYKEELYKNFFICPKCNEYQKITPKARFKFFFDNGEFEILKPPRTRTSLYQLQLSTIGIILSDSKIYRKPRTRRSNTFGLYKHSRTSTK